MTIYSTMLWNRLLLRVSIQVWGLCVGSYICFVIIIHEPTNCPCSRSIDSPPGLILISRLNLSANLEKEWQSCLCTCVYLYVGTVYRASVFYLVPAILLLPLVTRMNEEIKAGTSDALKHATCYMLHATWSVASKKYFWSEETINYHNSSRQALSLELEPPCLCD